MAEDYPDQSYQPSWKCRLTVRLEEFNSPALATKVPGKSPKITNGIKDENSGSEAVPDPDHPGRFLIRAQRPKDVLVPETSSDGLTHVIGGVIPKQFDWKQNGFRTADELKLTIRTADLPIDPRCLRAIAVEFYLGTLTPMQFAMGIRGLTRAAVLSPGAPNASEPLNIVPDTYVGPRGEDRTNQRFLGWVDKWKAGWSMDEPVIELECRDNTQLFMNQLAPAKLVVSAKDPLDKAIAVYLSNFPQFAGMTVEYVGVEGEPAPSLDKVLSGVAFRPALGPQPSGGDDDLVVWDYLTDVCGALGFSIYVEGLRVIIARPATLLGGVVSNRSTDPYTTRKLPSGAFPARALIYGKNVEGLEITRDFANKETKNIELRCYNVRRKQLMVSRFPSKDARIVTSTPGDKAAENKWNIVKVHGIESQAHLDQMAEDYFNGRNRSEIECVVKTKNLASFGGGNADPDLLDLKAGDAIEILIDRAGGSTPAEAEANLTAPSANEKMLTDLGYSKDFATAYAITYLNAGFQRLYRVREMSVTGDLDSGVSFEIRACNFIQVRGEAPATKAAVRKGGEGGGRPPAKGKKS